MHDSSESGTSKRLHTDDERNPNNLSGRQKKKDFFFALMFKAFPTEGNFD